MLLPQAATTVATPVNHHFVRNLLSPDRLLGVAQHLLIDVLPKVLVILFVAWLLIRIVGYFTDRMVRIAERHAAAATRLSQARTLSSVLRATAIGIIGFMALLMILPLIGFNLAPLLASAGVAGVAIGLACQTVVKDCLNGMLILLEDQYNVGDVIKIAGLGGQVESMTLRKTMLRDGDGTLYIIPNSQITTVANQTRDFSVATINVDVDFSADPDEVIRILKATALSVRNDPAYKDAFLDDPTLLGVDAMKGSVVTYPVLLKTKANQQWAAKRELQRRIRVALEENGLLPGDPLRVYRRDGGHDTAGMQHPDHGQKAPETVDPTTIQPHQVNPFTGEGL